MRPSRRTRLATLVIALFFVLAGCNYLADKFLDAFEWMAGRGVPIWLAATAAFNLVATVAALIIAAFVALDR